MAVDLKTKLWPVDMFQNVFCVLSRIFQRDELLRAAVCSEPRLSQVLPLQQNFDWTLYLIGRCSLPPVLRPVEGLKGNPSNPTAEWIQVLFNSQTQPPSVSFVFDSMLACVLIGFIWSPRALFSFLVVVVVLTWMLQSKQSAVGISGILSMSVAANVTGC